MSTKTDLANRTLHASARRLVSWSPGLLVSLSLLLTVGCQSTRWHKPTSDYLTLDGWKKPNVTLPPPPQETVFRAGHWEQAEPPQPGTLAGDLASGKVLFNEGKHKDAAAVFEWVGTRAEKRKDAVIHEQCLYWQAECLHALREWPAARDKYHELLKLYPSSQFRNEAVQREFEIAKFWLNDTRQEMAKDPEGKSWFRVPRLLSFEKEKPTFDEEGHAVAACEAIYLQDPTGPLAPQALYWAAGVNYYREDYDDADRYYSTLVEQFPRSPLAPYALELAIQSKIHTTGGPNYDGRKLIEARDLTDTALRSYPELANKRDFLERTLLSINNQQAEKDYNAAEFYRRTGHPGAAYFYYEVVRRRYAGSEWADKAYSRMLELRAKVEATGAGAELNLDLKP